MNNAFTALRRTILATLVILAGNVSAQTAQQVAMMRQQQWAQYQQQVAA